MLAIKRLDSLTADQGEYLVRLISYRDPARPELETDEFGYVCDRAHLRQMLLELLRHFRDEVASADELESLRLENMRLREQLRAVCQVYGHNWVARADGTEGQMCTICHARLVYDDGITARERESA